MRFAIFAVALMATAASGCKQKSQLVVGLITNLKVRGELTDVQMDLSRNDVLFQSYSWNISDQKSLDFILPGSFTLFSDNGGEPVTQIVVTGFQGDKTRVVRRSTIQLQSEQDVFYRMSLVLKCTTGSPNATDQCPDGFSCVEGVCKPDTVDAKTLRPYEASRVSDVECDSGTAFFDTSTCSSGTCAAIPPSSQVCAADEFCSEGTCYKRDPNAPRLLEFGEACDPTSTDACRETGLVCAATAKNDRARCRQTCTTDADCTRRLPDALAKSVPATDAHCTAIAGKTERECTYACDALNVTDGGCTSGTICSIVDVDNATQPLGPDCISVRSSLPVVPLGGACTSEVGQCGAGAVCVTGALGSHCQALCRMDGTACPGVLMCKPLTDSMQRPSPLWGVCCPVGGCQ
jgi:hypothetical protein